MSKLVKKKSTAPKKVVQAKPKKVKATKVSKKEKDVNKPKNKKRKNRHWFLAGILTLFILIASGALAFCIYIITSAPKFEVEKLYKSSSSILYDSEMNVIAELGLEIRENVTYDELSEVLVDAIVATEDSKFFQHNGIDLLRFSKAVLGQLMGQSDAGGGSTLTMQIVKNTYNGTASHGIKGIIRKFTDIYMAVFKVEKTYTKQEIIEFYVNQAYLGSGAYGVEQASQTYFGKSASELNLSEAATIAGLFQAPSAYDPFIYTEKAEARRNLVLGLMVRHGYITPEEASAARAIKLDDLLVKREYKQLEYQGFINTVISDVYNKTGLDPYTTSMTIYTTMVASKQNVINELYTNPNVYKWANDIVQCGIAVTSVHDGSIVAIGAGRNRGAKTYNYATNINRHPGSTAKPILDYGPAIEYAGWGTGTTVVDDVYSYSSGGGINNVDFAYHGILTAKLALARSRNIPALQAFQATTQKQKYEFVTNLGITPELHNGQILESSAIGAFNGVSPLELSAAYGTFSRGGYYIEPYSFTKIIYHETGETYAYTPTKEKAMSEQTAYMINMMLKYAVTSGNIGVGSVPGTDVASKTGTSSVSSSWGLGPGAIMDAWQVSYSPDYSIAFWYGYDNPADKKYHLTQNEGWAARKAIVRVLTPNIMEKNSRWTRPSGIVTVDIELETNPVMLASPYTPDNLRSTEYYRKGTEPTEVSTRFTQLSNVKNLTYSTLGNQVTLSWDPIKTPDAIDDIYLLNYYETAFPRWAKKYYENRVQYNEKNIGVLEYEIFVKNSDGTLVSLGLTTANSFNTSIIDGTEATFVVKSTYSIFKNNASSGTEITVKVDSVIPDVPDIGDDDDEEDASDDNNGNGNENIENPSDNNKPNNDETQSTEQ